MLEDTIGLDNTMLRVRCVLTFTALRVRTADLCINHKKKGGGANGICKPSCKWSTEDGLKCLGHQQDVVEGEPDFNIVRSKRCCTALSRTRGTSQRRRYSSDASSSGLAARRAHEGAEKLLTLHVHRTELVCCCCFTNTEV